MLEFGQNDTRRIVVVFGFYTKLANLAIVDFFTAFVCIASTHALRIRLVKTISLIPTHASISFNRRWSQTSVVENMRRHVAPRPHLAS